MSLKTTLLLLCTSILASHLSAQEKAHVLHVNGQIEYYAQHGAKPILLTPGMELDMKGKIRCKGTASAKLLCNGRTALVSGNKMRDLEEVVGAKSGESSTGFTGRFLNFVEESVQESDSEEALKKHHQQNMNKASGGIKGYANKEYTIIPSLLASGKLPASIVTFKWQSVAGDGPYTFTLIVSGANTVAQMLVTDTIITLDLKQLAMMPDEAYEWRVTRGSAAKSAAMPIEIAAGVKESVQNTLARLPYYKSASTFEQQIMLAYTYEEDKCYYCASQVYSELFATEANNQLLRSLYATFLARMDMLQEAVVLASGH